MARHILGFGLILGLIGGLCGCGDSGDDETEPATEAVFVGEVSGTQMAIAVVVGAPAGEASGRATVYVCDGIETSRWFFGTVADDVIAAEADAGAVVQATVTGDQVTGTVDIAGSGPLEFTATLSTGVAGVYLVDQTATGAQGLSASGAELQADIDGATATGTVVLPDGTQSPLAGDLAIFGESEGTASWIVQSDGDVRGSVSTRRCGRLTLQKVINEVFFGVHCSFD